VQKSIKLKERKSNMMYDDYFEEPSELEQHAEEFKRAIMKSVRREHQEKMESLIKENERLHAVEKEMKDTTKRYNNQLFEMEYKKTNLKSEVEAEFYKTNIADIFQRYIDDSVVWYAASISYEQPKCDLCNEERKQVATFPDGKETYKSCDCMRKFTVYEPRISTIKRVRFHKRDSRYASDRSFYFSKLYEPNTNDSRDYAWQGFVIGYVFEVFDEKSKQLYEENHTAEIISFSSEEECRKYCDWLNTEKGLIIGVTKALEPAKIT